VVNNALHNVTLAKAKIAIKNRQAPGQAS